MNFIKAFFLALLIMIVSFSGLAAIVWASFYLPVGFLHTARNVTFIFFIFMGFYYIAFSILESNNENKTRSLKGRKPNGN